MSEDEGDTSGEALLRAAQETAAIIDKYKRGRSGGVHIDPWEDPVTSAVSCTDRYGFVHETALPPLQDASEMRSRQIEVERQKKWLKMTQKWDEVSGSGKFRRRVFKGVPDSLRGRVWRLFLLQQDDDKEGIYMQMLQAATSPPTSFSPDIRQIDLDINRTYRDHIMFRERYDLKQIALFHVLAAYSVYNAEIGYCQGMSQIAALLLMYLEEEDAFWSLNTLLTSKRFAMHGFFIPGFPKLIRFQEHHNVIMQKFLPKLKKHLDKHGVETGIYTLKWFFQCFLDRIPFSLTLRVWDVFLMDGDRILTCMAYNLLKMHQKTLLKSQMDEILKFLQIDLARDFRHSDDETMRNLQNIIIELHRMELDSPGNPLAEELPRRPLGALPPPNPAPARARLPANQVTSPLSQQNGGAEPPSGKIRPRGGSGSGSGASYSATGSVVSSGGSQRSLTATSATSTADVSRHDTNSLTITNDDVVRIYVSYDPPPQPIRNIPSSINHNRPNRLILSPDTVRINVNEDMDMKTPIVEFGQFVPRRISPEMNTS